MTSPKNKTASMKWEFFFRTLELVQPFHGRIAILLVLICVNTLLGLIPTYLIRPLTDKVFAPTMPIPVDDRIASLHQYMLGFVLIYVLSTIIICILQYNQKRLSSSINFYLRGKLFDHLQKLSLSFLGKSSLGSLQSRITSDANTIQEFFVYDLNRLFVDIFMFLGIGGILLYLDWKLTLLLLAPMPIVIILSILCSKLLVFSYRRLNRKNANMNSALFNILRNMIVIITNATEKIESARFHKANQAVFSETVSLARLNALFFPAIGFIIYLSGILLRWFSGLQVINNEMSLGEMYVFVGYAVQFFGPINQINNIHANYQRNVAAGERYFHILNSVPDIQDPVDAPELPTIRGLIKYNDVSFCYDGKRNVLEGINIEIQPGEILGITGLSGGGKTTLANLLCRLYDVRSGSITIDGHDIRNVRLESLRSQIGLVLQETLLFPGTVAENIAYARPEASKSGIIFAAKAAGAHDFIMNLPDAYDTHLGEGGSGLSVGEKQRISIARVLLKNPRIIILDEATSSVDLATEDIIKNNIRMLAKDRTILIIAHSPAMLGIADKLIAVDKGRIVKCKAIDGPHGVMHFFDQLIKEKMQEKALREKRTVYVA